MSTKIHRDDWTWLSLFGPKNLNGLPSTEGNIQEDYEVDEEYIEGEPMDAEENEEDFNKEEEAEGMLVNYDDDEED